jgi:hypothetical protein
MHAVPSGFPSGKRLTKAFSLGILSSPCVITANLTNLTN